jgi:hypothetical protein
MAFNVPQPFQNGLQNQVPNQLTPQMPLEPNSINPQGFTNQNNINSIYGQANPGTFTRSVQSPLMQTIDPSVIPAVDPTDPNMQAGVQNVMAATGIPTQY